MLSQALDQEICDLDARLAELIDMERTWHMHYKDAASAGMSAVLVGECNPDGHSRASSLLSDLIQEALTREKTYYTALSKSKKHARETVDLSSFTAIESQVMHLQTAESQLATLQQASDVMHADIGKAETYADDVNDMVFHQVARHFKATMAHILPKLACEVSLLGEHASGGISVSVTAASDDDSTCVQPKTLQELSGGQKSLCSLAYILAASMAGMSPGTLLVDEVDAALDDVNQTRVAAMLTKCCHDNGCQIWAASHSSAFHVHCDCFIQVAHGPAGTTLRLVEAQEVQRAAKRLKVRSKGA
jgi:chromosome segregation ATPase